MYLNKPRIIEALGELADVAQQRRLWLADSGPEISSFSEAVEGLFDDSGLDDILERGGTAYGAEIDTLLRELENVLKKVGRDQPVVDLIDSLEMDNVRKFAARALKAIEGQG